MTNWVTIKIPADVRDAAREDDRTYGEIMQAGIAHKAVREHIDEQPESDETADYDEFIETMKNIQSSAQTAEERTGQIQRQLEEMGQR